MILNQESKEQEYLYNRASVSHEYLICKIKAQNFKNYVRMFVNISNMIPDY